MTDPNLLSEPRGLRGGELPHMVLLVKDEEYFIAANISISALYLLPPKGGEEWHDWWESLRGLAMTD